MSVIFVHPKTPTFMVEIFPMSLPALIARAPAPVRGYFEDELTDAVIRAARVVLMDIHWYVSLAAAVALIDRIKRVNPDAFIVAGGVAASLFHRQIVDRTPIDFIIRGDAERPLPALVQALLEDADWTGVPNLVTRDWTSPQRYGVTTDDLDTGDYRDISWFPTMQRKVLRLHRQARGKSFPVFPHLVSFRGCPLPCEGCCGATIPQKRIFARHWIRRSAAPQRDDLRAWSADPRIRFVSVFHDFASMMSLDHTRAILDEEYDLSVYWEWFRTPRREALDRVLASFRGGTLLFSMDQFHATSAKVPDPDELIDRIRAAMAVGRFNVQLNFVSRYAKEDPVYRRTLEQVRRATSVWMHNADFWWQHNPMPGPEGLASDDDYDRCFAEQGRRFALFNMVFRAGVLTHRYAPRVAELGARLFLQHYRPDPHEPFVTYER